MPTPAKLISGREYVHQSCCELLSPTVRQQVLLAEELACTRRDQWNVVRLEPSISRIALLNYPAFFDDAFPMLQESWLVDLPSRQARYRTYVGSTNPPILHRKELLLPPEHPRFEEFSALTASAESIGLFEDRVRIGFKAHWEELIERKGYKLDGHTLVPVGNAVAEDTPSAERVEVQIARHRTALVRYGFSAPIQALVRHGFVDGALSIFDYGCGRGDDVRALQQNGIRATGWDPYYAPNEPVQPADIVNLGFVINVIEDIDERRLALGRAHALAARLLCVSAMIASNTAVAGRPYRDGTMTQRNTFQKYYSQSELRQFIATQLDQEPVAVGPGVFFVFKDELLEQRFLTERHRRRPRLDFTLGERAAEPRRNAETRVRVSPGSPERDTLLGRLWERWIALGREPDASEVEDLALKDHFVSIGRALSASAKRNDKGALEASRTARTDDLRVYFALEHFKQRRPYKALDTRLQRDIRAFFGSYKSAQTDGLALLCEIADIDKVSSACAKAEHVGLGYYDSGAFTVHSSMVNRLPAVLRVYVGCATILHGDVEDAALVKIHTRSGKLTLMYFDDFDEQPLPRLQRRIKLHLRRQDVDVFEYGAEHEPPFLYFKSRFINEEFPNYAEQVRFETDLLRSCNLDWAGYGPRPQDLLHALEQNRRELSGYAIVPATTIPSLDAKCGKYLTYRQMIECGDTQARTGIKNVPKQAATFNALYDLAVNILDPTIEYYGMVRLTYGFASPELTRCINARIAPKLDQHAGHELTRTGRHVCDRLGSAVDFIVEHEDMHEVATWIYKNLTFDRLYYYGPDRPVHVSYATDPKRAAFALVQTSTGRTVPRPFSPS